MSIQAVSQNANQNVNFQSQKTRLKSIEQYQGYEVRTYEKEASTGKKWGVGLASFALPGLGHAINGDWGKAIGFFFGTSLAPALVSIPIFLAGKKPQYFGIGMIASYVTALGVKIWDIASAVNNAKSEMTQVVSNQNKAQENLSVVA